MSHQQRPGQPVTERVPANREHFVQFYREPATMVASVSRYFAEGFRADESAILIATLEHRAGIEDQLRKDGFDLEALIGEERYFPLDASDALSRFMIDGLPDERLFSVMAGGFMSRAGRNRRGVRAFGEMVALLWAQGNRVAALQLEDLWNKLAASYSFALFCAYPIHSFGSADNSHLQHICKQHARCEFKV